LLMKHPKWVFAMRGAAGLTMRLRTGHNTDKGDCDTWL
jgi:hypothetical protein